MRKLLHQRSALTLAAAALLVVTAAGPVRAAWTGNANLTLGAKALEKDDWEPVEDQGEVGIRVDFRPVEWPVNLVVDLSISSGEDEETAFVPGVGFFKAEFDARTIEWNLGVRKIWEGAPHVRPYIGGGLAIIHAKVEAKFGGFSVDDDDTGLGFWLGGGVYWTLARHFNIGFDLRYSYAEVSLFGEDVNAGGGHAGLLLGYHW